MSFLKPLTSSVNWIYYIVKADMKSYIPMETAAIYKLGVCDGRFHLHGLTRAARSENRELQNEKFLPMPGLELTTTDALSITPPSLIYKRQCKTFPVENRCALCYLWLHRTMQERVSFCCVLSILVI